MDPDSSEGEETERDKRAIKTLAHQILSIWVADLEKQEKNSTSRSKEEEEKEEADEDRDSCESDQEWDVDSFKDVDFHSDDEPEDEDWRRYARQCYKSEGFDVGYDCLPKNKSRLYSGFNPVILDSCFSQSPEEITWRQHSEMMINVVIEKYNQSKASSLLNPLGAFMILTLCVCLVPQGKTFVLDHIVRTVVKMAVGVKAYITFMAKESPEVGELVEYQGKVEWKVWQRNYHPLLCRPASEQRD